MKKLYITITCICLMALASGCDKFLDIKPTGSVIPTTLAEYRALWATAYSTVPSDRGLADMGADEMFVSNPSDESRYSPIERWDIGTSTSTSATAFNWAGYYQVLFYANFIIEHAHEITEGSEAEINQIKGEAYAMRAYMHFVLANLFGQPYTRTGAPDTKAVPLKLDTDLEGESFRNTVGEIYTSVLADFRQAQTLLNVDKWDDPTLTYRFTVGSIPALLSRVYLYMGDWTNAYAAAEEALKTHAALEDFRAEGFKLPNQYQSVEAILPLEMTVTSSYKNAVSVLPSFLALYADGDLRPNAFFAAADKNGNRACLKGGDNSFRCTIRSAELYLNSAEAAAQLGKPEEARQRLLQLMEKRYTAEAFAQKKTQVEAMQKDALINEIISERARELAFEGQRWFDLRRTTRPRLEKHIADKDYVLEQDDARYTLRIPREAIAANPNLNN